MADHYDDFANRLKEGEIVKCPQCGIGIVKPDPVDTPPDKALYFKCTNVECNLLLHFDPMVIVE